jgi:peptidyl-dipeptidase Dcp
LLLAQRFKNNELDNQQNVFKIAKLRFDRANFRIRYSLAVLEERMAES